MAIYRLKLGRWQFTFTIAPTARTTGVNSLLPDGNHIIMWDFDDIPLPDVRGYLLEMQDIYRLPRIQIVETLPPTFQRRTKLEKYGKTEYTSLYKTGNYAAYCFKRCTFRKALEIVICTTGVDMPYIKWSIHRGHFTLRVFPKCGRSIRVIETLPSDVPEDVSIYELRSWVHYDTIEDNYAPKKVEVQLPPERVYWEL